MNAPPSAGPADEPAPAKAGGYRDRDLDTRLGTLNLHIPKLRQGSYFPPFLESRKTSEKALVAVIQEAWIGGVSTRKVDELAKAMGLSGISKSSVSRLCADIDERADAFPGQAGGLHVGPSEAEVFWSDFLKALRARGLRGVKLVIFDAHEGLKAALSRIMNATWRRCRVHERQ